MVKRAEEVSDILKAHNISCEIIELPTVSPLDKDSIANTAIKTKFVITIEDNIKSGGMGEHIAEILMSANIQCQFRIFAFPNEPITHGTITQLDKKYGIDAESISDYVIKELS